MAPPKKTLYQILGVPRDASEVDIGLAYEMRSAELQRAVPPDPSAIALVHEANEILSNPTRRAAYDAALATAAAKSAAAASQPDAEVVAEPEPVRKFPVMPVAIGALAVLLLLFFVMRPAPPPPPPAPVAAPKPAAPPPPKLKIGAEILADASTSTGQVLSYSMAGAATPVGLALAIDAGTMVTTCHGIPAGSKLVVRVANESYPADLAITDESLDLCKLTVTGFTTPPLKVATEEPKAGQKIFAVAANARGEFAATEGTIKQVHKTPLGNVLEVSMPIAPTGSGGGIFDEQGRLVGIATTPHKFGSGSVALPTTWLAEMRSRTKAP